MHMSVCLGGRGWGVSMCAYVCVFGGEGVGGKHVCICLCV